MFGMGDLLKQAQEMQANIQKVQAELANILVDGSSGGGMVKVVCTAGQELVSINIDPVLIDPNEKSMLEDMVQAAVNDALRNAKKRSEEEMAKITNGIKLPGGFNLPAGFKLPF
ncbi:YbaB/EbfC family nucleoid-associated protein [Desulfovibrio litoralis]|uniref:Nucleoid-associated protein SAMN02745728_00115 n=1 Tax=Desulfovibrio litoralis DSM 11393 TaxID=1121455 RepID=A0A1M7RSW7_9BACT|nr:YbaB/EbfC family nucleoid-associated protein [Desulfovibrio litoralis]SHN49270.1 hypothetical protein SAMN02745728_00115 [Desulfovibrio litoralis DSM 11393]